MNSSREKRPDVQEMEPHVQHRERKMCPDSHQIRLRGSTKTGTLATGALIFPARRPFVQGRNEFGRG